MGNGWRTVAAICAAGLTAGTGSALHAQGASNVVTLTPDTTATTVTPGQYYTRVQVDAPDFTVPLDDKGKKAWGKAILAAFGAGGKARSLTVALTLSHNGVALPTVPLIIYEFDGKERVTNYKRLSNYTSPAWQVGAATPVSATLSYLYSEQATYDPDAISNNIAQIIPSATIVSAIHAPVIQSMAALTARIYAAAGSRRVRAEDQINLTPYTSPIGARGVTFRIATPRGDRLGDIVLKLVVSPTLARPPILAAQAAPADFARQADENIATLAVEQGGTRRPLLADARALPEYVALNKDRGLPAVRAYCLRANTYFDGFGLTAMDRTMVTYQSLLDAGFTTADNGWLLTCFDQAADRTALTRAVGVGFVPAAPPPPAIDPSGPGWPVALKWAMGCWLTNQTGPDCQARAADARAILTAGMADQVALGVVDLPTIDDDNLFSRMLPKGDVLDRIKGKADRFLCFQQGLIVTAGERVYALGVTMQGDRIAALQLTNAAPSAAQCLG